MFLVLQGTVPLVFYLHLVEWQVNSMETTRKFLQISHLLLHFSIEQLFSFIILYILNVYIYIYIYIYMYIYILNIYIYIYMYMYVYLQCNIKVVI